MLSSGTPCRCRRKIHDNYLSKRAHDRPSTFVVTANHTTGAVSELWHHWAECRHTPAQHGSNAAKVRDILGESGPQAPRSQIQFTHSGAGGGCKLPIDIAAACGSLAPLHHRLKRFADTQRRSNFRQPTAAIIKAHGLPIPPPTAGHRTHQTLRNEGYVGPLALPRAQAGSNTELSAMGYYSQLLSRIRRGTSAAALALWKLSRFIWQPPAPD